MPKQSEMDRMGIPHRVGGKDFVLPPSMTPTRQVGRSMNDIDRIAEQQRRRGNFRPMLQLGMMSKQQDFAREQNATGFAQQKEMFGMEDAARAKRDQTQREYQSEMWKKGNDAQKERDQGFWQNQLTMFGLNQGAQAMEEERKRNQEEQDRMRTPNISTVPVQGTDYVMPVADGRVMGTLPTRPTAPLPPGMVPMQAQRDGVQYGVPKPAKPEKPQITWQDDGSGTRIPYQTIINEDGSVSLRRVKIIDENNDGIDDRQQQGGAPQESTGGGGTTKSGITYKRAP